MTEVEAKEYMGKTYYSGGGRRGMTRRVDVAIVKSFECKRNN